METTIYNTQGKKTGSFNLPETVFGVSWNDSLMHQIVTSMLANARTSVAHTKFRGEVRGGGKKPWQQKGTGRSRHGSSRSPIWKGGGVTHGPRKEKVFTRVIPKRMRAKALFIALSRKLRDNQIILIDSLGISVPKTTEAKRTLVSLAKVKGYERLLASKNAALIALPVSSEAVTKSFRNIGSVRTEAIANINPVSVLKYKYIIIENPEQSIPVVEKRLARKATTENFVSKKVFSKQTTKKTK